MDTEAGRPGQPVPDHDGWFLSNVNRHQRDGRMTTEVAVTFYRDEEAAQGETLVFTIAGAQPRSAILAAAGEHIDRFGGLPARKL